MYIYTIKSEYIDFLSGFDNRIKTKGNRPYVGVLFEINNYKYFAPLSSPSQSDYDKDGKIRRSIPTIHRIIIKSMDKVDFLGTIRFSSMIPVIDGIYDLFDINSTKNEKYKTLLRKQIDYLRINNDRLMKNAITLYNQKNNTYFTKNYLENTVDFTLLEEKLNSFILK